MEDKRLIEYIHARFDQLGKVDINSVDSAVRSQIIGQMKELTNLSKMISNGGVVRRIENGQIVTKQY
jgi:hypothetical protein